MNATSRNNDKAAILKNRKKKPPLIAIDEDAIPESLKQFDRWLAWSWQWNSKRKMWDKPPLNARTGNHASSTDRTSWCDYRTAVDAVQSGRFDGLGFALGPDDGNVNFAGVDFDDCRDPETGAISPDVQSFVKMLNSYAEVSPSRTGVKVICIGSLPRGRRTNKAGTVEMYDGGRYFTITGSVLDRVSRDVANRQGQLNEVYDALIGSETGGHRGHQHGDRHGDDQRHDRDLAIAALGGLAVKRADNYEDWLKVGMALHTVSPDLLSEWDHWSQQSDKYIEGETARKWESFQHKGGTVVGLGTLIYWAKEDGWNPPQQAPRRRSINRRCTDYGNAERFVDQHGGNIRYCHVWKKWLVWNGKRWEPDESGATVRLAKRTVRTIYESAADEPDPDKRGKTAKWAYDSEQSARIAAMLRLAESEQPIPIAIDELDADPWLFNCENGTVNLKTGELQPHRRGDFITKIAPVEYPDEPGVDAVLWQSFLNRIFVNNSEMVAFVQRLMGMAAVGEIIDHALPIFYGKGDNGKTVFVETELGIFGDYAMKATQELLMASRHERHPTEKADLHGRRLVAAVESDDGRRLAEAAVKEMTGGDTISARHMKQDFFRFKPSHSPILVTNHKPKVYGTDHSIWRRLYLVPFTVRIPKAEQDRFLTQKLRNEWPAILRWIVEGCLAWQRDGLAPPPEILAATAEYRRSEDVLGDFFAERCVTDPQEEVRTGDLYAAYVDWAENTNEKVISKRAFGGRMTKRDEFERSESSPWRYFGIGLKDA